LVFTVFAALLCLYMAWSIGANDVANSMGVTVGSRALTFRRAILVAAVCEFAGAVLVGSDVSDTVRKGIVNPEVFADAPEQFALGMLCALAACAVWLHIATWLGMPVSTTHSIVGAVAGFGAVAAGVQSVCWPKLGAIVLSWVTSPLAGLVLGFLAFRLLTRLVLGRSDPVAAAVHATPAIVFIVVALITLATIYDGLKNILPPERLAATGHDACLMAGSVGLAAAVVSRGFVGRFVRTSAWAPLPEQLHRVERVFIPLAVLSSCSVAFGHGANDVANAVGPLAAVLDTMRTAAVKPSVHVPAWTLAVGGAGIVLGLSPYGYSVIRTIGTRITEITPSRALAANVATAATVLVCTRLKLPVSTSHTVIGAVLGVGIARGLGAVNARVVRNVFGTWLITVPGTALMAIAAFLLARLCNADDLIRQLMTLQPPIGTP